MPKPADDKSASLESLIADFSAKIGEITSKPGLDDVLVETLQKLWAAAQDTVWSGAEAHLKLGR